jgi:hypothetical protein
LAFGVTVLEAYVHGVKEDLNRHGLDPFGRVFGFCVGPKLATETEIYFTKGVEARIGGPHAFKPLSHGSEGTLHCARLDTLTAWGNFPRSVALAKDL